jgi:hypothetical protein
MNAQGCGGRREGWSGCRSSGSGGSGSGSSSGRRVDLQSNATHNPWVRLTCIVSSMLLACGGMTALEPTTSGGGGNSGGMGGVGVGGASSSNQSSVGGVNQVAEGTGGATSTWCKCFKSTTPDGCGGGVASCVQCSASMTAADVCNLCPNPSVPLPQCTLVGLNCAYSDGSGCKCNANGVWSCTGI